MVHTKRRLILNGGVSLCFFWLVGCVGPAPREDYSLAKTALDAARTAQAEKFAPGLMGEAEDLYRQALADYEERHYQDAQTKFVKARQLAEKAENFTAIKKSETGEAP
jgi:hypothetical protein